MTSPLRMKRLITRRARIISPRTGASWLACWLVVIGYVLSGSASAQEPPPPPLPPVPSLPVGAPLAEAPVRQPAGASADAPAGEPVTTAVFMSKPGEGQQAEIQRVVQEMPFRLKDRPEETYDITASTELPGPERLFRRQ